MQLLLTEIEQRLDSFSRLILSAPKEKDPSLPDKLLLKRRVTREGKSAFSVESTVNNQAKQKSLEEGGVLPFVKKSLEERHFRQINLFVPEGEISFRISKKGKVSRSVNRKTAPAKVETSHNREKNYLIREGDPVPFMVELGVFTKEYKVVHAMYDKFRQINRFIEILDHAFSDFEKEEISVLDFGCGKSYLTFFVYYYFAVLKKKRVHITGYDLKEDVVANCNALAKKFGYHGLSFVVADVTRDALAQRPIDFVISLHACDIATDYALNFALEREVPYIFSVPCCQHEVLSQIKKGQGELDLFLGHGLFKERMSALLTDAFRAKILESEGYRVDVLEFVDFAHSPKNLMLRAKKKAGSRPKSLKHLTEMEEKYGFRQTLLHLRMKEDS